MIDVSGSKAAIGSVLLCAAVLLAAPSARARGGDQATAEVLFRQGRQLLEAGDVAAACPKFESSYELDPALGTLLGMALCHERMGRLASAWVEYTEAVGTAHRLNQPQRQSFAQSKVAELEPRLSKLTIDVPDQTAQLEGLVVLRDGTALGPSAWRVATPIDGGEHTVEVTAPGKLPWKQTFSIPNEGASRTVSVPLLEEAPAPVATETERAEAQQAGSIKESPERPPDQDGLTSLQWGGIASAAAGVVSLGVGGYFLADALEKNGVENGAEASGNVATALGAVGLVALGTGATLFFVGASEGGQAQTQPPPVQIGVVVGPQRWGAAAWGRF